MRSPTQVEPLEVAGAELDAELVLDRVDQRDVRRPSPSPRRRRRSSPGSSTMVSSPKVVRNTSVSRSIDVRHSVTPCSQPLTTQVRWIGAPGAVKAAGSAAQRVAPSGLLAGVGEAVPRIEIGHHAVAPGREVDARRPRCSRPRRRAARARPAPAPRRRGRAPGSSSAACRSRAAAAVLAPRPAPPRSARGRRSGRRGAPEGRRAPGRARKASSSAWLRRRVVRLNWLVLLMSCTTRAMLSRVDRADPRRHAEARLVVLERAGARRAARRLGARPVLPGAVAVGVGEGRRLEVGIVLERARGSRSDPRAGSARRPPAARGAPRRARRGCRRGR